MIKALLPSVILALVCANAYASDGGLYYETETVTRQTSFDTESKKSVNVAPGTTAKHTCVTCAMAQPVQVKTHTEVIEHYQVYQPVTVYQPVGTYATRRVIENKPCGCRQ